MTVVENLTPRVQYNYVAEQQEYPITFPYIERQYVKCMVGDTLLTYNIDYQIPAFDQESLDDNELYLTLLITPTVGDVITIYRETPLDQQAEFPQTAKFSSQKITEALDKLTQQQQEQQDDLNTCLRLSKNIPVDFNTELPEPAANQVIQWNENGTQLINYDLRSEIQTIDTKADTAIDKADSAISTANGAVTTADSAVSKANSAISTANTAESKANNAVSTANNASTAAGNAVTTANNAATTAGNAVNTANGAVNTANGAVNTANSAKNKVDSFETDIQAVISAADKINELEEAVQTAVDAANTVETIMPAQTGKTGKYLKTNGTTASWEDVEANQIQSDWNQTDTTAKDYIKNKPTIPTVPTALSSFIDDLGSSPVHTHSQYITDISGKEDILKAINVLESSGTITLSDNSINTITPSDAVTFTLPTVTDNTKFHQILVQVDLSTVYSIDLGLGVTPHYFNNTAPDMSEAGVYNLVYEYDKANQYWVGGTIEKGVEE